MCSTLPAKEDSTTEETKKGSSPTKESAGDGEEQKGTIITFQTTYRSMTFRFETFQLKLSGICARVVWLSSREFDGLICISVSQSTCSCACWYALTFLLIVRTYRDDKLKKIAFSLFRLSNKTRQHYLFCVHLLFIWRMNEWKLITTCTHPFLSFFLILCCVHVRTKLRTL